MRLAATSEESESTNLLESNVTTYRHDTPAENIKGESEDPLVTSDSPKMAERDVVGMLGHIAYSFHNNPLISKCLWAVLIIIVGIVVMCAIFGTNTIFVNIFGSKENADSLTQLEVFGPTPNSDSSAEVDFLKDCLPEEATSLQVSSFREYEAKILEASSACVHLTISISNPSDWNANSNMPKAELVTSLLINGAISQKLFLSILTQLSQVQDVHISNEKNAFCRNIQKSRDTPVMPYKSTYTSKVKSVKFSDFSICTHFYKNFGNYLRLETLLTIGFNNSMFTNDNINHIRKILNGSRKTLQNLEINGTTNATQKFYSPNESFLEIRTLKLNLNSMVNNEVTHFSLFDVNFCASFPNLERFESTTGVTYSDILVILKCKNLKAVISTVIFVEEDGFWNINESIKSKRLRFLKLYFIFPGDCPSQQQIKQLGLSEDRKGVSKIVSMNKCSISTENTDSKEVHFVEEYSKT